MRLKNALVRLTKEPKSVKHYHERPEKRANNDAVTGLNNRNMSEANQKSARIRNNPYLSKISSTLSAKGYGNMLNNNFEPSRGGTGNKLNAASDKFTITPPANISTSAGDVISNANSIRIEIPNIIASAIFENGPATPTRADPHR